MGDLELINRLVLALEFSIKSADEWCETASGTDNEGLDEERKVLAFAHGYLLGKGDRG